MGYEMEVNRLNGIPWPRWHTTPPKELIKVPLKEEYALHTMDYLDTPEARCIFEKQAQIIIDNNIQGIVDIGCRIGIVNDILQELNYKNYTYMGFDTSSEPITFANNKYKDYKNIEYRQASMYSKKDITVSFDVDCVIWSGVLLYAPDTHLELFDDLTYNFYNSKHAIIQEPCSNQDSNKFLDNIELNTIEKDLHLYENKYNNYKECIVNANIFSGRRKIVHIWK
jgi:SAM-dependent methyltransferase|tara:strand:+ start:1233 stop:1907 length:675 start_codon:yes stop_codon:yes gene_type:complete